MRVISGRFKGLSLVAPKTGTRPTTDRVKEALFSHLDNEWVLEGARVLDLFAGTGALGFEAMSRGASSAVFVDNSAQAIALLKKSVAAAKKLGSWEPQLQLSVRRAKVEAYVAHLSSSDEFSLVFADPPYEFSSEKFDDLMDALASSGALSSDAVIVAERSTLGEAALAPQDWEIQQSRNYGETAITYFVRA